MKKFKIKFESKQKISGNFHKDKKDNLDFPTHKISCNDKIISQYYRIVKACKRMVEIDPCFKYFEFGIEGECPEEQATQGNIAAFENVSGNKILALSSNHGLNNGDKIIITGSDYYSEEYIVSSVTSDSFKIISDFLSARSCKWELVK